MTSAQMLRKHLTSRPRGSDQARGPTITAVLVDGPLHGIRIDTEVVRKLDQLVRPAGRR